MEESVRLKFGHAGDEFLRGSGEQLWGTLSRIRQKLALSFVGGEESLCKAPDVKGLFLFFQITDSTLIQLSIHCPRLQVLVSIRREASSIFFL